MSIVLINVCGFLACSAVVVIGAKSIYKESQIVPDPNDYPIEIPLEERDIIADIVGLSVEVVGYGLDHVGYAAENVFNSRAFNWLRDLCASLQFKPDNVYFKNTNNESSFWAGYIDDTPKIKPGKYEMEI